jgi:hypothetical protein
MTESWLAGVDPCDRHGCERHEFDVDRVLRAVCALTTSLRRSGVSGEVCRMIGYGERGKFVPEQFADGAARQAVHEHDG